MFPLILRKHFGDSYNLVPLNSKKEKITLKGIITVKTSSSSKIRNGYSDTLSIVVKDYTIVFILCPQSNNVIQFIYRINNFTINIVVTNNNSYYGNSKVYHV
ncbi:hypothetical protein ACTA71_010329 [Dictyostelium dimigraforme]